MKVIDNRNNETLKEFCKLHIGDGFEWDGKPYLKINDEYAFNLIEIEEQEITGFYMWVTPLNITITIEK